MDNGLKDQRNNTGNDAPIDWNRYHLLPEMQERKYDANQKVTKAE